MPSLKGGLFPSHFFHPVPILLFLSAIVNYKNENYTFLFLNLRSTIYSNTLIAAIVLQTLSAFCISKFVNIVTKIYMTCILSSGSLSTLRNSNAGQALICHSNLFVHHNAIQLNERSPEQFQTIKHMNWRNARNAMETLENVL